MPRRGTAGRRRPLARRALLPRVCGGTFPGPRRARGALDGQRIQADLAIARLAGPGVSVLRAVVHEQHQTRGTQTVDQAVEQGLSLVVDPVEVFDDEEERLRSGLAQEHLLRVVDGALPTGR